MDMDSPWKEAIEEYFEAFVDFFFPDIHKEIEWSNGYQFLDKELEKIVPNAKTGRRIVDKLVKVYLRDGKETWLLIHIELQGYQDSTFEKRMYVYHYRIFDRYDVEVVSIGIFLDDNPEYAPDEYRTSRWGCELTFRFPTIKMLDYADKWSELEENDNPFTVVVMAHLKARKHPKGEAGERKRWKLQLTRLLYERGYTKKDIRSLFRFIDWLMELPPGLEKEFWKDLQAIEEVKKMPYVTSVERIGIEKGLQQGLQQGLQKGQIKKAVDMIIDTIEIRFGSVPGDIRKAISSIEDGALLKHLHRHAVLCDGIDTFRAELPSSKA